MTFRLFLLSVFTSVTVCSDTFKDRIWLWGNPTNANFTGYGYSYTANRMQPDAAADYLGIRNIVMVPFGASVPSDPSPPNFESYYDARNFARFTNIHWALNPPLHESNLKAAYFQKAFTLAEKKNNVSGFQLDDIFQFSPVLLTPNDFATLL